MAHEGQHVVYRAASSEYRPAVITEIVSGTNVHLVVLGDASAAAAFFDGPGGNGIAQGAGVGQWQEDTGVDPAVSSEIDADVAAEASARDAAISAAIAGPIADDIEEAIDAAAPSYCAVPAAGSAPSLALNTARQPSTTRPVRVTVSGTWAWSLSAIGSQAGVATLQSDSNSTPTTARVDASCARGISVGITIGDTGTMPWCLTYDVPAGHYYQVATSGTGAFAITRINEQVM